jgi:hypothetical protein
MKLNTPLFVTTLPLRFFLAPPSDQVQTKCMIDSPSLRFTILGSSSFIPPDQPFFDFVDSSAVFCIDLVYPRLHHANYGPSVESF